MQRIHPAGAEDDVRTATLLNGLLTGQLGFAVDVERRGRVVFLPGAGTLTVEHVVGGVMHQQCAIGLAPLGQRGRHVGVEHLRQLALFGFGLVHGRVGRGVDHNMGTHAIQQRAGGLGIGQIQLIDGDRHHLAQRLQGADQLPADLPGSACDYKLHSYTSASANGLPTLSLSDTRTTLAPPTCSSGQSMPSTGSDHSSERSCAGA